MEKFYNNPAWRRIRGLRSFGILALSVAFCLTGLLALSSCDLEFWGDDDEAEPEPTEMRGFYTSIDEDDATDCQSEFVQVYLEGEEVAERESNVTLITRGEAFGAAYFPQIGVEVGESAHHPETIVTIYVSETEGVFDRPGSYFLAARTDAEGQTIYTGYWSGYAYRPGGEGESKPVVVCPYVLVPGDTAELADLEAGKCGANGDVHEDLQEYLTKDGSTLRDCWHLLDDDGVLSPMEN